MPRDNDKNNDSRGRRDRPFGGKGRSGAARGPEKKFAKRGFAGKSEGEKRPYAGKPDGVKSYGKKPYSGPGKPYAGKREGPPPRRDYDDARPRGDRPEPRKDFRPRDDHGGEKRPYTPRGDRPNYNRDDRAPRTGIARAARAIAAMLARLRASRTRNSATGNLTRRGKGAARSDPTRRAAKVFARTVTVPAAIGLLPIVRRAIDPLAIVPEETARTVRGRRVMATDPAAIGRKDNLVATRNFRDRCARIVVRARILAIVRIAAIRNRGRSAMLLRLTTSGAIRVPPRDGARNFDKPNFDKPRFDKPRYDKPREDRGGDERPRFSRPREDRPQGDRRQDERPFRERPKFDRPREDRPKFERPRRDRDPGEGGSSWQEHPRSEARSFDRNADRPRRDNEDDSKVFAKRPAFGGRGAYRERTPDERRSPRPPREKKSGERIAKVVSRAGLASRRDAEEWIVQGRVTVNGRVINSPALDVTANDVITVDGKPLPPRERTRLFLFHKPRGLMTTHADPEGRPTVFDNLPEGLPRLISIGRLDFNTEGLLAAHQ